MIPVAEALERVLALAPPARAEAVPLAEGFGRVLAAPAVTALTQPPFDAASMDGYAVRAADLPGPLAVVGEAAAGHPFAGGAQPGTAVRIFTGAPVPPGYDRVVMQENTAREGDRVTVTDLAGGSNIRAQGNDFAAGFPLPAGRRLGPAEIGLLAAMNVPRIDVAARPVVAILAGGDELVPLGTDPAPGQIVSSNDLAIAALVTEAGGIPRLLPIARDTEDSLRASFAAAAGADLIVTIGGASVGDHDLIGRVTEGLGMDRAFWKIAMRPGKPLVAGRLGAVPLLGLPGNPVSALVTGVLFLAPLIARMQGLDGRPRLGRARLGTSLPPEGPRQHYLRARLAPAGDALPTITPFTDQDSARLTVMADADALLVRPPHDPAREKGAVVDVLPLRPCF